MVAKYCIYYIIQSPTVISQVVGTLFTVFPLVFSPNSTDWRLMVQQHKWQIEGGPPMKLYVGNLVYNMTEAELNELFSSCGPVSSVRIITDYFTRQSKNFGYVEMSTTEAAYKAMAELHGETINDRSLVVKKARIRDDFLGQDQ